MNDRPLDTQARDTMNEGNLAPPSGDYRGDV